MKNILISGGCGFVGRNMVRRLMKDPNNRIVFVDDLSVGDHPDTWLGKEKVSTHENVTVYGEQGGNSNDAQLFFLHDDFRKTLFNLNQDADYLQKKLQITIDKFADVFHFAAIVGGRMKIDGDPVMVALDLSIDAEFFYWVSRHKPDRVLYPSSSAAYPVDLQTAGAAIALKESDIDFKRMGQPDMTYGWTKLTGEFLAQITAKHYGVSIACIRPFSGYGEDQNLTYPIPAIARRAALKENPFEVWGTGKQGRDFVHIEDVLDCTLMAMDKISDGTAINIGMGKLTSFLEIIDVFTDFAGYKPTIKPLLDKPVGVHSRYCDMSYVEDNWGWKPKISIREGMRRVYEKHCQSV